MRAPTHLPTSAPMSPAQVAQTTNTSRRTVMRAIEAQELPAFRDNRNHWKITPQAVEQWAPAQYAPSEQTPTLNENEHPSAHRSPTVAYAADELSTEREARRVAEIEAAQLRGKLIATEAERDRLYEIVQNLTEAQNKSVKATRRSWWLWKRS